MAMRIPLSVTTFSMSATLCTGQPSIEVPDEVGVGVKAGRDAQLRALAREVGQQRLSQAAQAHQRHVLVRGSVQQALDAGQAGVHLVAAVGAAGVTDDHEVAAHLGRADPGQVGELVRVDVGGARGS